MYLHLGKFVARYWWLVISLWLVAVALVLSFAPSWNDVTYDGDLAYLPDYMPSVRAERILEEAFPYDRAKSQIVLVYARNDQPLGIDDLRTADETIRRLHNLHGVASLHRADRLTTQAIAATQDGDTDAATALHHRAVVASDAALAAFDESIRLDQYLLEKGFIGSADQFAIAYHNRSILQRHRKDQIASDKDRQTAGRLDSTLDDSTVGPLPAWAGSLPLLGVWTRHTDVVREKLRSDNRRAQLVVLQLSTEFMAVENLPLMHHIKEELERAQRRVEFRGLDGLHIGLSGSAAVGGDMLLSARDSIRYTEFFTLALVLLILMFVYRSPLLVAVPLITIGVSTVVAMGLVAALTQLHDVPGFSWWDFKVFKTTRIFVVVILFGAGTDYCLFLISRFRDELDRGETRPEALASALAKVGSALVASALTTILGLAMMWFAEFGKFSYSGPAIALCLAVTLLACVTLAPALLRLLGKRVFWAQGTRRGTGSRVNRSVRFWNRIAAMIVARPGLILIASFALLAPLAWQGTTVDVTYDFLSALDDTRPSKQGHSLLEKHFPVGESGPLVVLIYKQDGGFDSPNRDIARRAVYAIGALTEQLYEIDGVLAVRSISEPLGDRPGEVSLLSAEGRRKLAMRSSPIVRNIFLTEVPRLEGDVARLELVLAHDPFSVAAIHVVDAVEEQLSDESADPDSFWCSAEFTFSGTTASMRDLRSVTRADNVRIQVLVVAAVLTVLLLILRRPLICLYMIFSVLFSYYVTIGTTQIFFATVYGDSYQGLDWKVPVFLFVILVAVGQDYNVYLATRVFEEQQRLGAFAGLREAIVRTGGIITSCGVIMAGTFISMTGGTWSPILCQWVPVLEGWLPAGGGTLRGIVELGFALALGVTLDTFVVRTVLLPAFLALLCRRAAAEG